MQVFRDKCHLKAEFLKNQQDLRHPDGTRVLVGRKHPGVDDKGAQARTALAGTVAMQGVTGEVARQILRPLIPEFCLVNELEALYPAVGARSTGLSFMVDYG